MVLRRRFALVYNARAGIALPRLLDGVIECLRTNGCQVFPLPARSAEEATERVAHAVSMSSCDAIISAGGDGTFRAVATGAAGSRVDVGVVPLGTGNVMAHELGLPRRANGLADLLVRGGTVAAQAGTVNGKPFFLMVGAGFDAGIIAKLNYRTKRALGRAAFTRPILKTFTEGPRAFDVNVDGARMRATWVIVSKASRYGGSFRLTAETAVGAPDMIAIVVAAATRMQLAEASASLAFGTLGSAIKRPSFVQVLRASKVQIGLSDEAPIQIDGDDAGVSPVSIGNDGPVVNVIAPPNYVRA